MKLLRGLAVTTALVGLSVGMAAAAPAIVETDLNLRSGPGTNFAVIDTIPAGATVDVLGCSGSWCRIAFQGETGYASAGYLEARGGSTGYAAPPAVVYEDQAYDYDYDPYYYGYGPAVGVGIYAAPRYRHWRGERWRDRNWARGDGWRGRDWSGGPSGPAVQGPVAAPSPAMGGRMSGNIGGGGRGGASSAGGGSMGGGGSAGGGASVGGRAGAGGTTGTVSGAMR